MGGIPAVAVVASRSVIISDEENTSEYSHYMSSYHSTLESIADMPQIIKKMNKRPSTDSENESSDSDSEEICDEVSVATQFNNIVLTAEKIN